MRFRSSNTPHDHFFAQLMSRKPVAHAVFGRFMPDDLRVQADLSLIEPVESKHISDDGTVLYNDVLYRCPLLSGQMVYFFAMAEQQRDPERFMPLRMGKYDIGTFEDCFRQNCKHLPIILHFVFYNGHVPWPYSTAFDDYYADPVLGAKYFHIAPFILINIPEYRLEMIQEDKELGFCFGAFYASTQPDPYKTFADLMNVPSFEEHIRCLPVEDKYIVARYLGHLVSRKKYALKDVVDLVSNNTKQGEDIMISIAQTYERAALRRGREEGIQTGMQKGRREALSQTAQYMLNSLHLGLEQVQQATGLSRKMLEKLAL